MNQPAIHCENLSKQYGDVQALSGLDLTVAAGSVFGFLGRNGAGKTTAIRLMTGLARPSAGSAWIQGMETTNSDSAARTAFGYLPQDPAFYNWMTPLEYLDYVGRIFNLDGPTRKQRIGEVLALVDLEDAAKRRIGGFSGGMGQRLGIAQALLHRPPVLFLDEPTSALDPAGRYEVLDLINRLRGNVTVFLSSHILGDVERVCDTVGIIHKGKLLLVAARDELLSRYATNVIALVLDRACEGLRPSLIAALEQADWVTAVTPDNLDATAVRITVANPEKAKQQILPLVLAQGVALTRYEWIRPSLEDVFLQMSA
ncbi:MAG: ABC transporter ATP-binding protein [Chloroflexi bacterium]|nr:ABC transporter ATP-binding protein [Chloroflexota bacterium]MBP7043064.1 ABC transporter ATP-binding protein [Chloroflexota bacterium]